MIKLIIIAGLLFSHAGYAASKGRVQLKQFFSCETSMRTNLSAERTVLFADAKRLFEKYELVAILMSEEIQERMRLREETFMASLRSLVGRINDTRDNSLLENLRAELQELEAIIDDSMTPVERNMVSYRFSAAGKRAMETRHFGEDWSDLDKPETPPRAEGRQPGPIQALPDTPPNYGGWDMGFGLRPNWPPREKK